MTEKLYDLSPLFEDGATMWPRFANEIQVRARAFAGVRSTGWHNENHPGWFDMGQPFPFQESLPGGMAGAWVGHLHVGTHVDAPIYCIPEGITADKIPLENLYGTGVIIDMRNKGKWGIITAEDFEKATPKIEAGDFVVVNTGWQKWLRPDKGYEYYHYYPGLLPSAAEWLVKKKVKAIAGTWPTCDHSLSFAPLEPLGKCMPQLHHDYVRETGKEPGPEFSYGFEGCLTMLLKNGVSCIENAGGDIDEVTGIRCTLCAWPFRMEDTDGAMVRLVALVEE